MEETKNGSRALDWMIGGVLGAIAAAVYFASMATYAFPGEGANLMALWSGLDSSTVNPHPLMSLFAKLFGCSNALGPVCGVISVVAIYHLTCVFVRRWVENEYLSAYADRAGRIAGVISAVVFMLAPAVLKSATHLEPRLCDATWALLAFLLVIPFRRFPAFGAAVKVTTSPAPSHRLVSATPVEPSTRTSPLLSDCTSRRDCTLRNVQ